MTMPHAKKSPGPEYLTQCVCFECRKSFKKNLEDPRFVPTCPDCGQVLEDMGRYFRAPRKADGKQWRKIEMLFRAGVYFGGTQSPELGRFPDTIREAREFIARNAEVLQVRLRRRGEFKETLIAEVTKKEAKRREVRARAMAKNRPNQALQPTATAVMHPADAGCPPAAAVADL